MRKLTDVELSKVLSRHSDGKLDHSSFGYPYISGDSKRPVTPPCGCVAGTALEPREIREAGVPRLINTGVALKVSFALSNAMDWKWNYPPDTDEMLRLLERAGLA